MFDGCLLCSCFYLRISFLLGFVILLWMLDFLNLWCVVRLVVYTAMFRGGWLKLFACMDWWNYLLDHVVVVLCVQRFL